SSPCDLQYLRLFPPASNASSYLLLLFRNDQLLTHTYLVRIVKLVAIRFEDLHVLIRASVELFANLRKCIARANRVSAGTLSAAYTRARRLRARRLRHLN